MITEADIAHWQRHAPWPTLEQIEQDLVLSRLIIEIANHPLLPSGARPADIAACFDSYRPDGWTVARATANLDAKLVNQDFRRDIEKLVTDWPAGFSMQSAGQVAHAVLGSIDKQLGVQS